MGTISTLRLTIPAEKPPRDEGVNAQELAVLANEPPADEKTPIPTKKAPTPPSTRGKKSD